jgi:Family of unknown function (DUF6134)
MFIGRRRFIGVIGAAAGLSCTSFPILPARGALATPQSLRFKAYCDNADVGTHTVMVEPSGNQTKVHVKIDLEVSAAFITLFSFRHDCEEIWESGRLLSLRSDTRDGGDKYRVTGHATPLGFRVEGAGGPTIAPADTYTSNSVWNTAILDQRTAIDVQHGGMIGLSVKPEGEQQVAVAGQQVPASKYQFVTPFIAGNVWYDKAGKWVKALFGKGDEQIEYRLVT